MSKARSRAARKIADKAAEAVDAMEEQDCESFQLELGTTKGEIVSVTFTYPRGRGILALSALVRLEEYGPGVMDRLKEQGDPSVIAAYDETH